jgi:peptide/nickel transport system permease protein
VLPYVLKRLAWAVVVFLAVTLSTYIIFFVIPTNRQGNIQGRDITTDVTAATGINGPVYKQYGEFLWRIVTVHSLGRSTTSREDVNAMLARAVPITASLILGGAVVWMLISIPIGILSAVRPRSLLDRTTMIFVLIGISVHPVSAAIATSSTPARARAAAARRSGRSTSSSRGSHSGYSLRLCTCG